MLSISSLGIQFNTMAESFTDKKKIKEYFSGRSSSADESWISTLFCDEKRKSELRDSMSEQFDELMQDDKEESNELDHILYRIHYHINTADRKVSPRITVLNWSLRIAGIIIIAVMIYWGVKGHRNYSLAETATAQINAPAWTRASFSLPDGTTGWLNSNSSIEYNVNFLKERRIKLNGEAFFDVAHDAKKMFTVEAGDIIVKVHGTRFNISSYEEEDNIEVVLEEGKIELTGRNIDSSLIMKPNDLAVYEKSNRLVSTDVVEVKKYLSWTEGKLVFRNDPIEVVARRLERWYNVDVEVEGSLNEDFRLRATFVDENLQEVLDILKKSLNIEYTIDDPLKNADGIYCKRKIKMYVKNR